MNKLSSQSSKSFKNCYCPKDLLRMLCVVLYKQQQTAALGTGIMTYLYCVSWIASAGGGG